MASQGGKHAYLYSELAELSSAMRAQERHHKPKHRKPLPGETFDQFWEHMTEGFRAFNLDIEKDK